MIQNGWVFISEPVFATAEFNQIEQWLKCLYYHMKSKKRPTLLEIQNRIILPHLHGIYAQQWIIDQCPNWKEYKDFIYKLSKEKRQTWLSSKGMYTRYKDQSVKKYMNQDPEVILKVYKKSLGVIKTRNMKELVKKKVQSIILTK